MLPEDKEKKTINVKDNILEKAIEVFSKHGYEGTSTRMISEAAKVNISALHYYWGDKWNLYQASLIRVNKRIHKMHLKIGEKIRFCSIEEKIDIAVKDMTDFFLDNPEGSSLILEVLHVNQNSKNEIDDEVKKSIYKNLSEVFNILYSETEPSKERMFEAFAITYLFYNLIKGKAYFQQVLSITDEEYKNYINNVIKKRFACILNEGN
ncbi:transcriptional regulator, TetR family [Dethiosulfatibacter aminovorans DSM 17477]|uniref:Transcriptional regulator, TetR family n=1 Tax=Dethiosulfatibacter aminovorans DSM 17477 TaxID=1121476 RepID=A0A1M6EYV6_9FIRM|nr:TetR/AcrR family transcriptional regulator [Dethiosulfatibacter aminovorans]SHI90605.1 transcriptional regulator, TetR family [Dethiosulfatibacter aminovorans DSM 17477]